MPGDDDDDDETLKAFNRLLEKVGTPWLDKVRPSGSSVPKTPGPDPIAEFFKTELAEAKASAAKMAEQMERMRDILTPEQLISLRSLKSGEPSEGGKKAIDGQPNNGKPLGSGSEPAGGNPPEPAAKPRRKWL